MALENDSPWLLAASFLLFFIGWTLSRGANMQKFFFKLMHAAPFWGGMLPVALELSAHKRKAGNGQKLLVSGFWGFARHLNYFGEILMSIAIWLPLAHASWTVWLYPLYYAVFLVARQRDDDTRCAAKYSKPLWDAYTLRVKSRIVPFFY